MRHTLSMLFAACALAVWAERAAAQSTSADASAQTNYVPSKLVEKVGDKPQGWSYAVTLAANLNVASNRDVVGQLEGNSVLFGASALAGASYLRDRHEWLNTFTLNEAWSKTPAISPFVKSNDVLELQSLYNFFLRTWTGPFARLALSSALLSTERVTPTDVAYANADNPAEAPVVTSEFELSNPFQPFTINESVGWFFQPLRSEPLNLYARVGFGGRHTFAEGARTVSADPSEPMVTFTELQDVHQAGAELFAGLDGKLDQRLLYNLGVSVLYPFINNDEEDRDILELTKVALSGALGMAVVSWLSVNYQLKVVRDVQLVDAVQVQNSLLLSLQYSHSEPPPPAQPAPTPASPAP